MQLIRGIHQCLVAEIRYQPGATDPITIGTTPGSSSRLAQRNLAIAESDNPGGEAAHIVQHTLLVKPSRVSKIRNGATDVQNNNLYDELVISWNDLPRNTKATIYFPEWNVDDVINLSHAFHQSPSPLVKADLNTIACTVNDLTYIPIPSAVTTPYAGLLTLQLPPTVRTGQKFRVDVQQHAGIVSDIIMKDREAIKNDKNKNFRFSLSKRKVLGAFSLRVLVKNGTDLLPTAVRNLAVLKYIALSIPATNHWYPVFKRYIEQIANKVKELGVDPALVIASADDPEVPGKSAVKNCYTGKICEVFFDCFGDFEGFILCTCAQNKIFRSKEKKIGKLSLRSCQKQWFVTICMDPEENKMKSITVH